MSASYQAPLWDLSPKYVRSEETDEFRWMEYRSVNDPLNDTNIRIRIDDGNSFLLASEAMLAVDFTVSATSTLVETDEVAIPNAWSLFDDAKLFLNDKLVQATNLPGVVHHITASHQYSIDYAESVAESQMFYPISKSDTPGTKFDILTMVNGISADFLRANYSYATTNGTVWLPMNDPFAPMQQKLSVVNGTAGTDFKLQYFGAATSAPIYRPNPQYDPVRARSVKRILDNAGVCSVFLPLREIWPILSQAMGRVNRGSKVEVQLTKCGDYARTFYTSTSPAGLKFVINRCSVWIPRLAPSLEAEAHIEAQIASGKELREPFEKFELYQKTGQTASDTTEQRVRITTQNSRVLRLYVGAQLDTQMTSLAKNPLQFDAQNFDYVEARVNGMKYPLETYQVNNTLGGKQGLIRMLRDIHQTAGKTYDYENGSVITYDGFVNGAQRIYVLDLTQMDQSPFKKQGISDLEIRYKLSSGTSGTYTVNVVVCSEGEMVSSLLNGKMLMTQV